MRHYEIVILVHPDQSEQCAGMVERYTTQIESHGGQVHRFEDWGRRPTAYPIGKEKIHKAHYLLLNIECNAETYAELMYAFRFNDAIIRHLVLNLKEAVKSPSPMVSGAAREE